MGIIRLLLALSVVVAHLGPILNVDLVGGEIAVHAFYIISGFYMSLILNQKYVGVNKSYWLFISNRLLRLLPVYWSILVLTFVFNLVNGYFIEDSFLTLGKYDQLEGKVAPFILLILTNIIVLGQDVVMFFGIDVSSGNLFFTSNFANTNPKLFTFLFVPQAWTLSLEICFYLLAPFLLKSKPKWILFILSLSITIRLLIFYGLNYKFDPWTYRFFPSELMFFLFGYISFRMLTLRKILFEHKWINMLIFWFNIIFTLFFYDIPCYGYTALSKEIAYFVSITLSIPFLFSMFKNNKFDLKIGELSFPIYISHILVILIFSKIKFPFTMNNGYVVLIILCFSYFLNYFIANPIEKIRQSRLNSN